MVHAQVDDISRVVRYERNISRLSPAPPRLLSRMYTRAYSRCVYPPPVDITSFDESADPRTTSSSGAIPRSCQSQNDHPCQTLSTTRELACQLSSPEPPLLRELRARPSTHTHTSFNVAPRASEIRVSDNSNLVAINYAINYDCSCVTNTNREEESKSKL